MLERRRPVSTGARRLASFWTSMRVRSTARFTSSDMRPNHRRNPRSYWRVLIRVDTSARLRGVTRARARATSHTPQQGVPPVAVPGEEGGDLRRSGRRRRDDDPRRPVVGGLDGDVVALVVHLNARVLFGVRVGRLRLRLEVSGE